MKGATWLAGQCSVADDVSDVLMRCDMCAPRGSASLRASELFADALSGHTVGVDELIELEQADWASLCAGTGHDFYGRMMTEDGVMVLADGSVMSRTDVVAALRKAPPWASYEMDDICVVPIGEDSAALVYVGTGHGNGDASSFVGVMTSVYVPRDDQWKLAVHQPTPEP